MSTYIPDRFRLPAPRYALEVVRRFPFATLVTVDSDEPRISHIPLLWNGPNEGPLEQGELIGHFAAKNPHTRLIDSCTPTVALFHGPHTYISPGWYVDTVITPTWNMVAVHVTGVMHPLENEKAEAALHELINTFERGSDTPWSGSAVPPEMWEGLRRGTVPMRMSVQRVEAKGKLSQNRTEADRQSVITQLRGLGDEAREMAEWIERVNGETSRSPED